MYVRQNAIFFNSTSDIQRGYFWSTSADDKSENRKVTAAEDRELWQYLEDVDPLGKCKMWRLGPGLRMRLMWAEEKLGVPL